MSDATIIEIKQLLEDRKKAFDELRTTVEALDKAKADGKAAARKPSGAVVTEFAPDMFMQTRRAIDRAAAEIGRETR